MTTTTAWQCPHCKQAFAGSEFTCAYVGGGPFSGPMDNATPPDEYLVCPGCSHAFKPDNANDVEVCDGCGAINPDKTHVCKEEA